MGPLINSKGRLEHPEKSLSLLTTDDPKEAFQNFNQLTLCNQERKNIQAQVVSEAKEQVLKEMYGGKHRITIAFAPHWHEGVIGIAASKMVDLFKVPAIIFCESAKEKGLIKGSARTAGPFNIHEALSQCSDLFSKFGGHRAAAGLSMPRENLSPFKTRMENYLKNIPPIERTASSPFDLTISINDISPELALELERLEPFGSGNPKPVFQIQDATVKSFQILKEQHVRWEFTPLGGGKVLRGISFFFMNRWETPTPQELFDKQQQGFSLTVQFSLGFNYFQGNKFIQLEVQDIF